MARPIPAIEGEIETRLEAMGMELVALDWAGSDARPILRLRVDFPASEPGRGVTVEDCARVSRALEEWLDEHPELPERYTLEVSSPGVERPLHRRRDFERFAGQEVVVKLDRPPEGQRSARLEGTLEGVAGDGEGYRVLLRLPGGLVMALPRTGVVEAHLLFRWDDEE